MQQSQYIPIEGARSIVIFIHGIVEGPNQFTHLMGIGNSVGYSVASLLLPGHGGSSKEFARTNKREWLEYVRNQINQYRKKYQNIILVGHSMGTLLSFLTYVENPKQIVGIVAIDSPLYVHMKWQAIRNNLKVGFCKKIPENDPANALLQATSVAPCSVFRYITWLPRIIDLFLLMAHTRKILDKIKIPTLVIHADRDELVSTSSVQVFERKLPETYRTIVRLSHSTHFVYAEEDLKMLHTLFINFLENISID